MIKMKNIRFGPLNVIMMLLILSAGLRTTGAVGIAFASADTPSSETAGTAEQENGTEDMDALLLSFQVREKEILEEEERIAKRSEELENVEAQIASKIGKLKASEARLRELLAIADVAAEDDVTRLTSVYESMKPKAAATVFEQMPPAFAAGFLSRMQPASAALVMASLTPETAYAISVVFAGRNAEKPPK
ncbi:MotE family protein [Planktotalea sp.]|uniref:MotE family protein n=1 Tax=Planktotalea sp. TaxID=2029877 RepID=UPI003F6AA53C